MSLDINDSFLSNTNFREHFTRLAYAQSQVKDIPLTGEDLNNPDTFNQRFTQLGLSIRHVVEATAELASTDSKYLSVMLTGYANPLVSETVPYNESFAPADFPSYDVNGLPLTVPFSARMFSLGSAALLSSVEYFPQVFVDGVLVSETSYRLFNTATGLKCFVNTNVLNTTSKVSIVINRIFDKSNKYVDILRASATSVAQSITLTVNKADLGEFYHTDYVQVYIKSADHKYRHLKANQITVSNKSDTQLSVLIKNTAIAVGETVHIVSALTFHKALTTRSSTSENGGYIDLTIPSNDGKGRPLPFGSITDFDLFFNGAKLIPEKHFTLEEVTGVSNYTHRLKMSFNHTTTSGYSVQLFKNEASMSERDGVYSVSEELNDKGIFVNTNEKSAILPRLSFTFVSGNFVPNENVEAIDSAVGVVHYKAKEDFQHYSRIVRTEALDGVIDGLGKSDADMISTWLGKGAILEILKNEADVQSADSTIRPFGFRLVDQSNINRGFTVMSTGNILSGYGAEGEIPVSNLVLDAPKDGREYVRKNGVWIVRATDRVGDIGVAGEMGFGVGIYPYHNTPEFEALKLQPMAFFEDKHNENYGNYIHENGSVMVFVPKFYYRTGDERSPHFAKYGANCIDIASVYDFKDTEAAVLEGYRLHRAFIDGGEEKYGFFFDKYLLSRDGDKVLSVKNGKPISLTTTNDGTLTTSMGLPNCVGQLHDSIELAKMRGEDYQCATAFMYSAFFILQLAHGMATKFAANNAWYNAALTTNFTKGCNSNTLSDVNDSSVKFTSCGDTLYPMKPLAGSGIPFAKTTHNGQSSGIADLNGSMYETGIGVTTFGVSATATAQILEGNDLWVLNEEVAIKTLTKGWNTATDVWGNEEHLATLYTKETLGLNITENQGRTIRWGNGVNPVFNGVSSLDGVLPSTEDSVSGGGTNLFGNDQVYPYNRQNMFMLFGGYWRYGSNAGLGGRYLNRYRADSNSIFGSRSAAYGQ